MNKVVLGKTLYFGKEAGSTKGGSYMVFQGFWDKFEQTGSVKDYLDYVKNVKPYDGRRQEADWDCDWEAWDESDDGFDED